MIPTPHGKVVDTRSMSNRRRRPPRPEPVTVHNGTGSAFVYDQAGRVIPAGANRDADATDPLTAILIAEKTLHVIQENK